MSVDIAVFGATGFVGKLTAEYLARNAPDGVTVALAGRSQEKLERVRSELGVDWPLITGDSSDAASMKALAEQAKVVATTVGPYRKYGLPLVEACATAGTHYADLTGEVLFMRDTIERFHATAEGSGARIVHNCGFDSIPSDIGVFLLHEEAQEELTDTTLVVRALKGGPSGGTLASMTGQIDDMRSAPGLAKAANDPYALSPDRAAEPDLGRQREIMAPVHDDDLGIWLGPFVMASINTRVVRRSNALQGWAYGKRFRYREAMGMGAGHVGRAKATGLAVGVGALVAGLTFPLTRKALDVVLPSPGEGPSEEAQEKGFFKIDVHTRTASGKKLVCHVAAQGDPGYKATAVMLGESALALALDGDELPDRAGVLTPSTAFGTVLPDRLRAAGHTYEVETLA
ncbi:MAG TPA: saccharopine dehydrogenase NADP-binding domain-containing protein [Solirubrobacteraceae bacterium]|nr:saccharopine dehydrogenase NADP-binding domain-containing protein [Solirubrobacteraceae bacterium]